MADALAQLPNDGNQNTAHESNYTTEIMSEFMIVMRYLKVYFKYLLKEYTNTNRKTPGRWINLKPLNINEVIVLEEGI